MTVTEIQGLTQSLIQGERQVNEEIAVEPKKKTRLSTKKAGSVVTMFKDTDTSDIQPQSTLFNGHEFYFISLKDFSQSKEEMERLVVSNGGTKVQNCLKSTTDLIATDSAVLKVRNIISTYDTDIVRPEWVLDCVARQELIPLRPKYMLHTSQRTLRDFEANFNRFGDCYFSDFKSGKELMEVANCVEQRVVDAEVGRFTENWMEDAAPEGFKREWENMQTQNLSDFRFFICGESDLLEDKLWKGLMEVRLTAFGGHLESRLTPQVTHIVRLPASNPANLPKNIPIVDVDWVLNLTKVEGKQGLGS